METLNSLHLRSVPALVLTLVRLCMSPVLFYRCVSGLYDMTTLVLFAVTMSTDALDGLVARAMGGVTECGAFLDRVADKFLVFSMMAGICYYGMSDGRFSGYEFLLCVATVIMFLRDGFVEWLRDISGTAHISHLGKLKTWMVSLAIGATLWRMGYGNIGGGLLFTDKSDVAMAEVVLWIGATFLVIVSGWFYVRSYTTR